MNEVINIIHEHYQLTILYNNLHIYTIHYYLFINRLNINFFIYINLIILIITLNNIS